MNPCQVKPYPKAPYQQVSGMYSLEAEGLDIPVAVYKDIQFARLGFEGEAEFTITVNEPITQFEISPRSFGIQAFVDDNKLRFKLKQGSHDRPYYLVIRINWFTNLILFADSLQQNDLSYYNPEQRTVYEVKFYGADPTGASSSQAAIQRAIDEAHEAGGGIVRLPGGVYRVAGILLKSHVSLFLEEGAFLRGDDQLSAYTGHWAPYPRFPNDPSNKLMVIPPLIDIRDAEHASIIGSGVIDCNNSAITTGKTMNHRISDYRRHIIATWDSSHIRLEGVTVMDSEWWCTRLNRSSSLHVKRYKVLNNLHRRTNDGINMEGSRNSVVEECFTHTGDDGLNAKASYDDHPTTNVTFRNSIVYSGELGLQLGWEDSADICNIRYENIDIIYSKMPLGLFTGKSVETKIGDIYDIEFIDIRAEKVEPPVWNQHNQNPDHHRSARPFTFWNMLPGSSIRNIRLRNVSIMWNNSPLPISIIGLDESNRTSGIMFDNVTIEGRSLDQLDKRFVTNDYIDDVTFK